MQQDGKPPSDQAMNNVQFDVLHRSVSRRWLASRAGETPCSSASPGHSRRIWCIGRLQTDADRARVIDGIATSGAGLNTKAADLNNLIKRLAPRWLLMRDLHSEQGLVILQSRWTMTYMRGPMTRNEIRRAREWRAGYQAPTPASNEFREGPVAGRVG
jgi:hypothetical protein